MLQNFSFDPGLVWMCQAGLEFAVTVHTFENMYTPVEPKPTDTGFVCDLLSFAGGRETVPCRFEAAVSGEEGAALVRLSVEMDREIRSVRLLLRNRAGGEIISRVDARPLAVDEKGVTLSYPEAWRTLATPLVVMKTNEGYESYRSLDTEVSAKRFVFSGGERVQAELIYDVPATKIGWGCVVPPWEISRGTAAEPLYEAHMKHLERVYDLPLWETRRDMPDWGRDLDLVVALHGMHWSGKIFSTYGEMLQKLEWIADRTDAGRVLVYLPGFEGRYYWQYGEYGACDALGGESGLGALTEGARGMGFHIAPMLGINIANTNCPGFERFGEASRFLTAGGVSPMNIVDWDNSRGYDHGWCGYLNPGAPQWQNRLTEQITRLWRMYGFDAVYLDISAMWIDDARFPVAEGVRTLVRRIREACGGCLVLGEGWYDGITDVFPIVQNGHTDGVMHYYDDAYPPLFDRHCRMFGHLCMGDPGSESTGVHELGFNAVTAVPLREGILPTLSLVGDTLERNPGGVLSILAQAEEYKRRFLKNHKNCL